MPYITSFERLAKQAGKIEQAQRSVTDALTVRFDFVPEQISYLLGNLNDLTTLGELLRLAITTDSLTTFQQQLITLTDVQLVS